MSEEALHIANLELKAFRGIERTLGLDFGRRLTIIYGGNATGKSSVAQAIEFAISGQVRDIEDGLIPAAFLANTRQATPGEVVLVLDSGATLRGATDRPRSEIENRFRQVGAVDWPDRQPLPITTTHVTTQGMLAKVLGNENAVTRNDLSGLCAGSHLRFMVGRAEKLADHFRQASSGRNMQAELRDAHAAFDTARLFVESLTITNPGAKVVAADVEARVASLASRLNLHGTSSLGEAVESLDQKLRDTENRVQVLQSLIERTREWGQAESELGQLTKQLAEGQAAERALVKSRQGVDDTIHSVQERLANSRRERTGWRDELAAIELQQQLRSRIAALEARSREVFESKEHAADDVHLAAGERDAVRRDAVVRASQVTGLRQLRDVWAAKAHALQQSAMLLAALAPEQDDVDSEAALGALEQEVAELEAETARIREEAAQARQLEADVSEQLARLSDSGQRLLAAINAMRSFAKDGCCPLCGHDHGDIHALEDHIRVASSAAMAGAELLRPQFEAAAAARLDRETGVTAMSARTDDTRRRVEVARERVARRRAERMALLDDVTLLLERAGLDVAIETEALGRVKAEVDGRLAGIDEELRAATEASADVEAQLVERERAVATRVSQLDQLTRLESELRDHVDRLKEGLQGDVGSVDVVERRSWLDEGEAEVRKLELELRQAEVERADIERRIADLQKEHAGSERRRQVAEAIVESVKAEFSSLGLPHDVTSLVEAEQQAVKRRAELLELKAVARDLAQQHRTLEESRALVSARLRLDAADETLKAVQFKQQLLQARSSDFEELYKRLGTLQNDTAEAVLASIRGPVNSLFHAMTAGCPWDLAFRLEDGKLGAVLTDGSASDVSATSVLNSAYVNVAAIALRLALASQQRWTTLRTVVLDDPILEMDHLTQSAMIDGFEAILASADAPWCDLQFVVTTWSEDFAVMAAHKLAHLNGTNDSGGAEQFIIHRLSSDLDGATTSQRHVPRWKRSAAAA